MPTVVTILGNRIAPALLDRYLARGNVQAQQAPQHGPPGAESNLFQPVYGAEVAAHGIFDEEAHASSPAAWLSTHRGVAAGVALAAAAGAVLLARAAGR